MNEYIKQISDRISVIRLGESKGTHNAEDVTIEKLTELIIGRKLETSYDEFRRPVENPEMILDVRNLSYKDSAGVPKVKNASFSIKGGEILGIAGVQGNGQEELIRAITGLIPFQEGTVKVCGKEIQKLSIMQKRNAGMSYIPEDRMIDGCAAEASIQDNMISTTFQKKTLSGSLFLKGKEIKKTSFSPFWKRVTSSLLSSLLVCPVNLK